jgi:hypothetical protein
MDEAIIEYKSTDQKIAGKEWFAAFLVATAAVVVLGLPYVLGYTLSEPGRVFTGVIMNPEDTLSYFAKMLQGYNGKWLYSIPFTPEQHDAAFLGGFYLVLGQIARWMGLSVEGIWHLARVVTSLSLFMVTFGFIGTFILDKQTRWIAYLIALFGSGLGWLLFLLQQPYWLGAFPIDFKMPEAHIFFSALTFPHVALGTTLILISFWFLYQISTGHPRSWLFSVSAGIANLVIGIVYPFLIYLVIFTSALYWLYSTYRAKNLDWIFTARLVVSLAIPAPLYVYYIYVNQSNDVFRSWASQALLPSPPWPHYLVAFGIFLLLAILTLISKEVSSSYKERVSLLWIWIISATVLVILPTNAQRRFVQGVHVPLSILAAGGLVSVVLPRISASRPFQKVISHPRYNEDGLKRFFITVIILFISMSNLYLLADLSVTTTMRQPYPFFRQEAEIEAVKWLRENTEESSIVLAAYETGNYVAARAGNRVFIGHWAETVDWDNKNDQVTRFYDGSTNDDWRRELLENFDINYLWHGPAERGLGAFDPSEVPYMVPVFENEDTIIYAIQ